MLHNSLFNINYFIEIKIFSVLGHTKNDLFLKISDMNPFLCVEIKKKILSKSFCVVNTHLCVFNPFFVYVKATVSKSSRKFQISNFALNPDMTLVSYRKMTVWEKKKFTELLARSCGTLFKVIP